MKNRRFVIALTIAVMMVVMFVPVVWSGDSLLPLRHSKEDGDLRMCTTCHDSEAKGFPYRRFEHTPLFGDTHKMAAAGNQRVCEMCHRPSFCSDCHGVGVELKPSVKLHGKSRQMPHRGDYLTRHRIDGRLNPAKCFRCHGRPKTVKTCMPCHR